MEFHRRVSCKVRTSSTDGGGLLGCEMSRIPHSVDNGLTAGSYNVSLKRRPRVTPRNIFWYSFHLEFHYHHVAGKIIKIGKFNELIGTQTRILPA
jgi:hypothetical protein